MKTRWSFRGRRWQACALIAAAAAVAGCRSAPAPVARQPAEGAFQQRIVATASAINAGDLDAARSQLERAGAAASTESQRSKVRSLDQLITGAEALMGGDPEAARIAWSRIEEDALHREVKHKARLIGMDVPDAPILDEPTR